MEPLSRICKCNICRKEELTNKALLPDGWLLLWNYDILICPECAAKWEKRWGVRPEYLLKGGEEIELRESS